MRVLVQRVEEASVTIDGEVIGQIGEGLVILVGFCMSDREGLIEPMALQVVNLRIIADEEGRFQYSLMQKPGEILVVPQFTLYGDTSNGRRPDFTQALTPALASDLFDIFVHVLEEKLGEERVAGGRFGAEMKVALVNDGPVTLMLEK
jgi:D-tyrosyl-tRNA(Tyr) deacylase